MRKPYNHQFGRRTIFLRPGLHTFAATADVPPSGAARDRVRHSQAGAANEKSSGVTTSDGLGERAKQRVRPLLTEDRTE